MPSCAYTVTSCCTTAGATTWPIWNQAITTASSATISEVWVRWNVTDGSSVVVDPMCTWRVWSSAATTTIVTAQVSTERTAAAEARARRAKVVRDEADKRADALLAQFLDEEQRAQYQKSRWFEVTRKDSKRRYRIAHGWAGNVKVFDEKDRLIEKLCIHPYQNVPIADNLLAQKLMLEADEALFRKTANITAMARAA